MSIEMLNWSLSYVLSWFPIDFSTGILQKTALRPTRIFWLARLKIKIQVCCCTCSLFHFFEFHFECVHMTPITAALLCRGLPPAGRARLLLRESSSCPNWQGVVTSDISYGSYWFPYISVDVLVYTAGLMIRSHAESSWLLTPFASKKITTDTRR